MEKEYLIREKPLKALLLFAFPMIIGNLFQQFYTMVDSVVVGRFVSENALAAVGASYSLTNVFISIAIGGGVGASVLVSRYFGARDYRRMKTSVSTALISFLVVSLALGGLGLLLGDQIMEVLNTPENIMEDAVTYLNIYFMGLPFLFMYNVLSAMFNALGKSRIPLYLLIFSSVFNVVLDLIMVCSFHMGVSGVAWATLIAQGISAVMAFLIFIREMRSYQSGEEIRWFDRREFGSMCRIALPSILQQVYSFYRHDAGPVGGKQLWRPDAGWIFRRNADRKYLYRAYGSYGKCDVLFYGSEPGSKAAGTGGERIPHSLRYCIWFWDPDLPDTGDLLQTFDPDVPGRRGHGPGSEYGYVLYAVYRFLFQFYRTENDYRRPFKRCGRYEDVYCGKSGEPGYPCSRGGNYGPQIRYCLCMVCGSYGMAGQLSYFFCQV